jgi:hypothetical protein
MIPGKDYTDSFSLVATDASVRLVIGLLLSYIINRRSVLRVSDDAFSYDHTHWSSTCLVLTIVDLLLLTTSAPGQNWAKPVSLLGNFGAS